MNMRFKIYHTEVFVLSYKITFTTNDFLILKYTKVVIILY